MVYGIRAPACLHHQLHQQVKQCVWSCSLTHDLFGISPFLFWHRMVRANALYHLSYHSHGQILCRPAFVIFTLCPPLKPRTECLVVQRVSSVSATSIPHSHCTGSEKAGDITITAHPRTNIASQAGGLYCTGGRITTS